MSIEHTESQAAYHYEQEAAYKKPNSNTVRRTVRALAISGAVFTGLTSIGQSPASAEAPESTAVESEFVSGSPNVLLEPPVIPDEAVVQVAAIIPDEPLEVVLQIPDQAPSPPVETIITETVVIADEVAKSESDVDSQPQSEAAPEMLERNAMDAKQLAQAVLEHPNVSFWRGSPNDRTYESFVDLAEDGKTFLYDVEYDDHEETPVEERLLLSVLDLADHYPVQINSLTTSKSHSDTSRHYRGLGIDLQASDEAAAMVRWLYDERREYGIHELIWNGGDEHGDFNGRVLLRGGQPHAWGPDTLASHSGHIHLSTFSDAELPRQSQAPEMVSNHETAQERSSLSLLSDNYHKITANIPTYEYAAKHYDSAKGLDSYGPRLDIEDIALLTYHAGWRGEDLAVAIALAAYSEGNSAVYVTNHAAADLPGYPEDTVAVGLLQVLARSDWEAVEPRRDRQENLDPLKNVENAFSIWQDQGWRTGWEAYRHDKHLPHMDEARAMVDHLAMLGFK